MGGMTSAPATERAGDVKFHAANAIPYGWLKANGATVSRTAYPALFAAIGETYGAGDGSTTFALPDLRGEFVRGFDDARGVDSGRVFGSVQAGSVEAHSHIYKSSVTAASGADASEPNAAGGTAQNTENAGGTETRPRNVAILACIKY